MKVTDYYPIFYTEDIEAETKRFTEDLGFAVKHRPKIEFLDYVTGGNSREAFFQKIHPLSPQNGHFYCEQVFEVIGAFIKQSTEAEGAKIDERIAAHTHGYRTGKHAKGDR